MLHLISVPLVGLKAPGRSCSKHERSSSSLHICPVRVYATFITLTLSWRAAENCVQETRNPVYRSSTVLELAKDEKTLHGGARLTVYSWTEQKDQNSATG